MYGWNNHQSNKSRKSTQNPSFSSDLLDEIYRSMDVGDEKFSEFKHWEEKLSSRPSGGDTTRASSVVEDEGTTSLRRAYLVKKWIDMRNAKILTRRRTRHSSLPEFNPKLDYYDDPISSSSWLSSALSSFGQPEGFCKYRSQKHSCFGPFRRPKHVQTNGSLEKHERKEIDYSLDNNQTNRIKYGTLIKSKARALKIYANLKKVKQPISPGGRLTTFLNTLFANGHLKKPKDLNSTGIDHNQLKRKSKSLHGSTCSSASSFTRSCLSKNSPRSREKLNNGIRRTVRFYPVSVIIDEHSRPCGEKSIYGEQDLTKVHATSIFERKDGDDDDDMASDSSSDLFELDHLSILKECEELPVFETTHFSTNRAIVDGLIY
nr:hypothetical protein [Tanacetum cinerariifolium]